MKQKTGNILEGILKRHPDGFGFVIPDDEKHPDVYIPFGKMGSALTNDRVQIMVYQKKRNRLNSYFGFVKSILKRDKEFAVGIFELKDNKPIVKDHNLSNNTDILVKNPNNIPIKTGECVKVKINSYPEDQSLFQGELVKNLGQISSSAKDDIKRVMAKYDIPFEFPKEVLKEVKHLPSEVKEEDFFNRKDLRSIPFVTIDGTTAQDFDDAIFVRKTDSWYQLYVAIADVSYYVKEDSFLDEEAFQRGNSTYFPDFCSPMLPEKLSNDLCSLRPHVPRLTMVQEMNIDFKGNRLKSYIYPAVIKSHKRLTYGQTQDILDGLSSEKGKYITSLKFAKSLAEILLNKFLREEGLNLDIPETLVLLNKQGEVQDIIKEKRLFSHLMIEQFMLESNKAVSAFLDSKKVPSMYRVHPPPEVEKLKNLEKFSNILGFSKPFKFRKNLTHFLSQYKNHKQVDLINTLVLRSLSQARYSAFNKGHYGLNFSSYTHFTSPIRRYCDLLIHRLIKKALLEKRSQSFSSKKVLENKANFISQREQNSVQAEREVNDIKIARLCKKYIGQSFTGYVSSVCSFGLFIGLKQFCVEGLVRFSDLQGFWEPDEFNLSVKNRATSYRIKFGDEVEVLMLASHVSKGRVDFKLLSHKGKTLSQPKDKDKSKRRRKNKKMF